MPPKKKKKKEKKKELGKQAKKELEEDAYRKYLLEIEVLNKDYDKYNERCKTVTSECDELIKKRNAARNRYEVIVKDKDHVLTFLKNYLQYLADKKVSTHIQKDEEAAKSQKRLSDMSELIKSLNKDSEKLGRKIAMDCILLKNKISVLDGVKVLRQNLLAGIKLAEDALAQQEDVLADKFNARVDRHYSVISDLRTKSEDFIEEFNKESAKGYYVSRVSHFKKYLKINLDSRVTLCKFTDYVLELYRKTHRMEQRKRILNGEIEFTQTMEIRLKKEYKNQNKEIAKLQIRYDTFVSINTRFQAKTERSKNLKEEVAEMRNRIENARLSEKRLVNATDNLAYNVSEGKSNLEKAKENVSELIFVLSATRKVVKSECFSYINDAGVSQDMTQLLLRQFLNLLDTTECDHLCEYDIESTDAFRTGNFKISPAPPSTSSSSMTATTDDFWESRKRRPSVGFRVPKDRQLSHHEVYILSEMGLLQKYIDRASDAMRLVKKR